jgi:hypothetical protein
MTASKDTSGSREQLPPRRSPEWFTALGFEKPFGLHTANLYEKLSFDWGAPLLEKGSYGQITEEMADCLPPPEDEAPLRAQQFADCYDQCRVRACVWRAATLFCLHLSRKLTVMQKHDHRVTSDESLCSCRNVQRRAGFGS